MEMATGKDSFCREAFSLIIQIAKFTNIRIYRITEAGLAREGKTLQEEDRNSPPAVLKLFLRTSVAILEAKDKLSGPTEGRPKPSYFTSRLTSN